MSARRLADKRHLPLYRRLHVRFCFVDLQVQVGPSSRGWALHLPRELGFGGNRVRVPTDQHCPGQRRLQVHSHRPRVSCWGVSVHNIRGLRFGRGVHLWC
ncbi:Hypothetical_protein [Hexamita inflata]|uniref:Hypothetical_protein n=1 Tax=Hexamita inflata TaxID=28002 RepID=A0AA86RFH4_9EUKA|nr:Hypothetical protein HINF_LOCUS63147 [Hexamita inflata]